MRTSWGRAIMAVLAFIALAMFYVMAHIVDLAVIYWFLMYIQLFITPLFTAFGYLFYVIRLSIPYIFMFFLVCFFFNLPAYKKKNIIKLSKYSIDIKAIKTNRFVLYLSQYNYIFIFALNLLLLFIVYYAYVHHRYLYLFSVFLFYIFILIFIKIKHWLLKDPTLHYKKVNMLVNLILALLIGTFMAMTLDDLHMSNFKVYGFENFWKLIDNKYFIKMSSKDTDWNRIFNWSKQVSMDRYILAYKKSLMNSSFSDMQNAPHDKQILSNNDINTNIIELHKMQNEEFRFGHFTNSIYKKFKKVFLIQLHIKSYNFLPTSEIVQRQKLFSWLADPSNIIDLSKYYLSEEVIQNTSYEDYLDLVHKRCNINNLTTKKVFLISLHKNKIDLKSLVFYADFHDSFNKNYSIFLNSKEIEIDLGFTNALDFEYNNIILDLDSDLNVIWGEFKNEIYILFKENKMSFSVLSKKFKKLYNIKTLKFSFKEDVLSDSQFKSGVESNEGKALTIPDFKKLKIWKTFKINYKELIYKHTLDVNKKLSLNETVDGTTKTVTVTDQAVDVLTDESVVPEENNSKDNLFFVFDDGISYSLSDDMKLKQMDKLIFDMPLDSNEEYDLEFIYENLDEIISTFRNTEFITEDKFTEIFINEVDNFIYEIQNKKIHEPTFSSLYHEILLLNSNDLSKYVIENYSLARHLLTSSRSFLTYEMWQSFMAKLLNLDIDSLSLGNLKDFSDYCKSDASDDLQFNFSLAFDILKKKNDLAKFQLIADLEGIPGSSYEYAVKYNALIDRYYWHEEQEELIDWIYEISFDAIVELMDTVRDVGDKENDFLFDMINSYLKQPRYVWAAQFFEDKHNTKPLNIAQIEAKYKFLCKMIDLNERQAFSLLQTPDSKVLDLEYINKLSDKRILDFNDLDNLKQLNYKVSRDIFILKMWPQRMQHLLIKEYPEIADDWVHWDHTDWHLDIFEFLGDTYGDDQQALNFDLGVAGGVGDICLNHGVFIQDMELLDDFFETKTFEKMIFFLDEFDAVMDFSFDKIIEEEEFFDTLYEDREVFREDYREFIVSYNKKLIQARLAVINKMSHDIDVKKAMLIKNDFQRICLMEIEAKYQDKMALEFRNVELEQLPIYDWSTFTFIEENIKIIREENMAILIKKIDLVDKQMDAFKAKTKILNYSKQKYTVQVKANILSKDVKVQSFLEKNWDDHNYFSNKSHKNNTDWYKVKKK